MNDYKAKILNFELIGIVFIVFVRSALHFTFDLSGRNPFAGIFSAVNESVWEHLKLSFWPALLYVIIEYRYLKKTAGNFYRQSCWHLPYAADYCFFFFLLIQNLQ